MQFLFAKFPINLEIAESALTPGMIDWGALEQLLTFHRTSLCKLESGPLMLCSYKLQQLGSKSADFSSCVPQHLTDHKDEIFP